MQINDNLGSPLQVTLANGQKSLTFTFHGYQFPISRLEDDSNWYRIKIEYRSGSLTVTDECCSFDANSFELLAKSLSKIQGHVQSKRHLLSPPYSQACELYLKSFTPSLRRPYRRRTGETIHPKFDRDLNGLFVEGQLCGFKFKLKTTTHELRVFKRVIDEVVKKYPTRYERKRYDINPVKILESKFQGAPVTEGVANWMTSWLEDDIKRNFESIERAIKRNARRKHQTNAILIQTLKKASMRARNDSIQKYR